MLSFNYFFIHPATDNFLKNLLWLKMNFNMFRFLKSEIGGALKIEHTVKIHFVWHYLPIEQWFIVFHHFGASVASFTWYLRSLSSTLDELLDMGRLFQRFMGRVIPLKPKNGITALQMAKIKIQKRWLELICSKPTVTMTSSSRKNDH